MAIRRANRAAGWSELGAKARAWRLIHATWSIAQMTGLLYMWWCVATRRRDARLWAAVGFLFVEGGALLVGRGDCPMGPQQEEWGDPVPFFELILPPRAAKAAVPVLAVVSAAAVAALVLRKPGLTKRT